MVSVAFSATHNNNTKDVFQFPGTAKTLPSFPLIQVITILTATVKQKELGYELQGSASHTGSEGPLSEFLTHLPLAHFDSPLMVTPISLDPQNDSHHRLGQPLAPSPRESSTEPLGLSVRQPFLYFICSDCKKRNQTILCEKTQARRHHA